MKIDGGCFCGQISFEANIDETSVRFCQCTDCQITSGSVGRHAVLVSEADLQIKGEPKIYVKTAESGNRRELGFCPTCGTQLFSAPEGAAAPRIVSLRVGSANQRAQLPPSASIWGQSKLPWLGTLDGLPTAEKQG